MSSATPNKVVFTPLPQSEIARLNEQRAFVAKFLSEHFPMLRLSKSKDDFAVLQKIIDSKLIMPDETWKLQSLGVVFGDALVVTNVGLAWCEVTDEYGTDPTLRLWQTTLQVTALTMLSKRVEDGMEVDVQDLADSIEKFIHDKASEFGPWA